MKKIFKIALAFLIIVGVAGCSKDSGKKDDKTAIEVWLTPQWKGVYSSDEEGADYDNFMKEAAKLFNEEHEDVEINVQVIPGEERGEKLSTAIQTKTLPDIFFDSSFALSEFAHMGVLLPLDDIIDDKTKSDIPEGIWDNVTINDKVYFFPFGHNPGTLVYNADLFKEVGLEELVADKTDIATWSLEDLDKILETIKEKSKDVSPLGLFAKNDQGDTWNLSWLRMFGSEFWNDEGKLAINDDKGVKALEKLAEWNKKGLTTVGPESLSSNDVNAMFQNQQVGVSFTNTVLYANMMNDMEAGTVDKFDARLANIPTHDGTVSFTYVTSSVVFDTKDENRTKAAKEFVKFYSTHEDLIKASVNTLPARNSVTEAFKTEMPLLDAYGKSAESIINFSNNTPGYSELRQVLYPELQAVYIGEKSPQDALNDYVEKGNEIIEKNAKKSVIID